MTKMPEPYIIEWTKKGWANKFYVTPPDAGSITKPLYTADQLKQYGRDLLEEAAKKCESQWANLAEKMYGQECARAIRAMKEQIK
jgi:hypothetical protein